MTRQHNATEQAIKEANGNASMDEVVKQVQAMTKKFCAEFPHVGIILTVFDKEQCVAHYDGRVNTQSALQSLEALTKYMFEVAKQVDPQGLQLYMMELKLRQAMEGMLREEGESPDMEDGRCTTCGHAKEDHDSDEGIGPCHHGESRGNSCACVQYRNGEE